MKSSSQSFPLMFPGSTMFPSFYKHLGFALFSFVKFDRITTVLNRSNEEENGGVSIVKRIRDLKRRRAARRFEAVKAIHKNDRSDVDLLVAFYEDNNERERRVRSDSEQSASSTSTSDVSNTAQNVSLRAALDQIDTEQSASSTAASAANDTDVYDVIIVGAGWAGLAAAMTLKAKGITNFIVLEAKDHIGGRSYTVNESFNGESIPIDYGAMWIHCGTSNPLYPILRTVGGIPTSESTYPERMYKSNGGGAYTDGQLNTYYDKLYENGFHAYQEDRQESTDVDETLQTTANKYLSTLSSTEEKTIAKYFMRNDIEFEYSGSMRDMSLWWWNNDCLSGHENDLFLPQGYSPLIEGYAAPIRSHVITGAPVTEIDYRSATSKVIYTKNSATTTLSSKHVIVTVPLGVLQANSISFVPKLPKSKRKNIKNIGMGKMNKIFMFWNPGDVFWPSNIEVFGDVVDRDVDFHFINPGSHNGGKPMLFAFFRGEYAESIENQSNFEDEITSRAMTALRNMFGNDIPNPEKVLISRWNIDPYTRGSYTYNRIGGSRKERRKLGKPIKRGRLFLSGEAINSSYFQTTHGAYLSGKKTANKVTKLLRRRSDDTF
jgi:monoamine oxidase